MVDYLWLIVALPLLGFLINILFGKRIGEPLTGWLGFSLVGISWLIALVPTLDFLFGHANPETIFYYSWIPMLGADVAILWDPLASLLVMIVTGTGVSSTKLVRYSPMASQPC